MSEILKAHLDDELSLLETAPEDILAGNPVTHSKAMLHSGEDLADGCTGVFVAEPGTVRAPSEARESFYVVEGRGRIENERGDSVEVSAGNLVVLPPDTWRWTFKTRLRAVFILGPTAHAEASTAAASQTAV